MQQNTISMVPDFTAEDSSELGQEVEQILEEKDTPSELPTEEKPVAEEPKTSVEDEDSNIQEELEGLKKEQQKLLKEIHDLRGQKREIKQEQLMVNQQQVDDLKDLHPEDVNTIERIMRAKGYVTKGEASSMYYESVKREEINKFLSSHPEYRPENDPGDLNWGQLEREFRTYYRAPEDPHQYGAVLEKIHSILNPTVADRTLEVKKHQVKTASSGAGASGGQRSSSGKKLSSTTINILRDGGWSDEEIKEMDE